MEIKFTIDGDSDFRTHHKIKSDLFRFGIKYKDCVNVGTGIEYTYTLKDFIEIDKINKYFGVVSGVLNVNISPVKTDNPSSSKNLT